MELKYHEVINALTEKFKYKYVKYLEIGLNDRNATFNHVRADEKWGVDVVPHFEPDFCMTSDEFFAGPGKKMSWNVAFIDGGHSKMQVINDVNSALGNLEDGGFLLCDDIFLDLDKPWLLDPQYCDDAFAAFGELRKRKDLICHAIKGNRFGVVMKGKNPTPQVPSDLKIESTFEFFEKHHEILTGPIEWSDFDLYFPGK